MQRSKCADPIPENFDSDAAPSERQNSRTENEAAAEDTRRRIRRLPPEVGVVLLTVGIAGVILPGPVGTPVLLAGGLVLMPLRYAVYQAFEDRVCNCHTAHQLFLAVDEHIVTGEDRHPCHEQLWRHEQQRL